MSEEKWSINSVDENGLLTTPPRYRNPTAQRYRFTLSEVQVSRVFPANERDTADRDVTAWLDLESEFGPFWCDIRNATNGYICGCLSASEVQRLAAVPVGGER